MERARRTKGTLGSAQYAPSAAHTPTTSGDSPRAAATSGNDPHGIGEGEGEGVGDGSGQGSGAGAGAV